MDSALMPLQGKVAVITGGSRGIGSASALAFAGAGADVVVASRKKEELEKVAEEIKARGRKGVAIASHVAKIDESKALIDKVMSEFGKIDILMNNAATNPFGGEIIDVEEWAWDVTMNVNLKGPFLLTQMVGRIMRDQGGGCIINVVSTAGLMTSELGVYSVSKAALIMLTKILAKEWGKYNIRVNAIAPGIVKTSMRALLWEKPEAEARSVKNTTLGRLGEPEDVAKLALFLASDASAYLTGAIIPVDGGQMLVGSPTPFLQK